MVNILTTAGMNATMIGTIIVGIISFALTLYQVWLNMKQADVKKQMTELIEIMQRVEENTRRS